MFEVRHLHVGPTTTANQNAGIRISRPIRRSEYLQTIPKTTNSKQILECLSVFTKKIAMIHYVIHLEDGLKQKRRI